MSTKTSIRQLSSQLTIEKLNIVNEAIDILESTMISGDVFTSPELVKHYCQLQLAAERDEILSCLFLTNQHHLISFERLFSGTVDGASVHPRVVVRRALELNAAAVIFTHNHPSGISEPSRQDVRITERLKQSLALIDIRVLDHIIVGAGEATSLAERGEM